MGCVADRSTVDPAEAHLPGSRRFVEHVVQPATPARTGKRETRRSQFDVVDDRLLAIWIEQVHRDAVARQQSEQPRFVWRAVAAGLVRLANAVAGCPNFEHVAQVAAERAAPGRVGRFAELGRAEDASVGDDDTG